MQEKIPVSVVVIAKNEEANIDACLGSVYGWADEIVLIDDNSADQTATVARKYTDNVITKKMEVEGGFRNWAYTQTRNTWVLSLDADEQVTGELQEEIRGVLESDPKYAAFSIPLRNYIGDYWVKYGGWYPAGKVRLFRKDKFKYENVKVHPRVFIDGVCGHLTKDIIHKGYPDIAHFMDSVNRQSTLEAEKWIDTGRKMSLGRIIWRTVDRFFRRYLGKKAHKDGLYGFVIAYFDSLYQVLSYVKYREMLRNKKI